MTSTVGPLCQSENPESTTGSIKHKEYILTEHIGCIPKQKIWKDAIQTYPRDLFPSILGEEIAIALTVVLSIVPKCRYIQSRNSEVS